MFKFFEKLFHSRDKPKNALMGSMQFFFGRSSAGQTVNERTALQVTAVYACVRILAESIVGLPLHKIKSQRNIAYVIAAACINFALRKL